MNGVNCVIHCVCCFVFFYRFLFLLFLHNSALKDLINQGRQKVMEATNALKALPREPLEDIIGQVVSNGAESWQ